MTTIIQEVTQKLKEINNHKEIYEQKRKEMIQEFKLNIEVLFKELFEAVPSLKSVNWKQYTPYFNDGDECIFNLRCVNFYNHIPEHYPSEANDLDMGDNQWGFCFYKYGTFDYDEKKYDLTKDEYNFLKFFFDTLNQNKFFLKEVIGDHCSVTLTKDGMHIADCDHD